MTTTKNQATLTMRQLMGKQVIKVETVVTKGLNERFPYIKKVDLQGNDWHTVISNFKLGEDGGYWDDIEVFGAFGFDLKYVYFQKRKYERGKVFPLHIACMQHVYVGNISPQTRTAPF